MLFVIAFSSSFVLVLVLLLFLSLSLPLLSFTVHFITVPFYSVCVVHARPGIILFAAVAAAAASFAAVCSSTAQAGSRQIQINKILIRY